MAGANPRRPKDEQSSDKSAAADSALADVYNDPRRLKGDEQIHTDLEEAQEALRHSQDEVRRLNDKFAKACEELEQRDLVLDALRAELRIVRALSDKLRDTMDRSVQAAAKEALASRLIASFMDSSIFASLRNLERGKARAAQVEAIEKSGVFDAAWYLRRYPDVAESGADPLQHYLDHGAWEGCDPHPLFDSTWYRSTYPEVERLGMTPLAHFVRVGAAKGYDPNPLFHTAWYLAQNPDVVAEQLNPLRHYMEYAEKGRNPNPLFDSAWYLHENPDVRESGENPLAHYIYAGIAEFRDPHPLFDTEWYLQQYEHVAAAGIDALEHYLTVGVFEGCRPGPEPGEDVARRRQRRHRKTRLEYVEHGTGADLESVPDSQASPTDIMGWQMRLGRRSRVASRFVGKIGVFVHLFYEDLAEEIASSLVAMPFEFKVYVSTNSHAKKTAIEATFQQFGIEPFVKVLPNRGWDIAPFLLGFVEEMRDHDICLKLHGKRSHHNSLKFGARWRRYLLSGLIGDQRNISFIVNNFVLHPDLGIMMLPHWRGIARRANVIGANYRPMRMLLRRTGLAFSLDQRIEFPSGSMFWFRASALAPLLDLGLTWTDFNECRARNLDATIAHGIERSILIFAAKAGFKWAVLPQRWLERTWSAQHRWGSVRALKQTAAKQR